MEKNEIKGDMNVKNTRSKNVAIIPGFGKNNIPIINGKSVLVLRLVQKGLNEGRYVAAYWRLDNIADISRKSIFRLVG